MAFVPDYRAASRGAAPGYAAVDAGLREHMLRIFNWMTSGLLLTGIVAYGVAHTELRYLFYQVVQTDYGMQVRPSGLGWLSMIAPLAFVMVLSFGINRLSRTAVQTLYWVFCVCMGASLTNIFLSYTDLSIVRVFFITAATFAAMSLWGYTTRTDLTRFGSFLFMGLIGIVIASIANVFLHSPAVYFVASIIGVLVFTGLTAFQVQQTKFNYTRFLYAAGPDAAAKSAVYDALSLYLSFINLFMILLQLSGTRSSSN